MVKGCSKEVWEDKKVKICGDYYNGELFICDECSKFKGDRKNG